MNDAADDAQPNIVMYATAACPYCGAARMLLKKKGLSYTEIAVANDKDKHREMVERSGRRTVPQIFIDDRPIGGFDDLYALERSGELDDMLGQRKE